MIPVDIAKVAESIITEAEWEQAEGAHERFKELLKVKQYGQLSDNICRSLNIEGY